MFCNLFYYAVRSVADLEDENSSFRPDMCHQIFNQRCVTFINYNMKYLDALFAEELIFIFIIALLVKPSLGMRISRFSCTSPLAASIHTWESDSSRKFLKLWQMELKYLHRYSILQFFMNFLNFDLCTMCITII